MAPGLPSKALMNLLNTPRFKLRTMYFRGSVQHPSDLAAVKAEFADCIFLMMPRSVLLFAHIQQYLEQHLCNVYPAFTRRASFMQC
jgi:hypothetical protein